MGRFMSKKIKVHTVITVLTLTLMSGLLAGCGNKTPLPAAEDFVLNEDTGATSRGILPGDTPETFLSAYEEYKLFTSTDNGETYQVLSAKEMPFDKDMTVLLPSFFIDGAPMDPDAFCKENDIEKSDLMNLLKSKEYLTSHRVEYRYLLFTWQNGVIEDIVSSYMDYNAESENLQSEEPQACGSRHGQVAGANWLLYSVA